MSAVIDFSSRGHHHRHRAAAHAPFASDLATFRELIHRVEVVSEAWAAAHDPSCLDVRFPWGKNDEIVDRFPKHTSSDQRRYKRWLTEMAGRLHRTIDVEKKELQRVNCYAGRARSPAVVLAWLRVHHGLKSHHLHWALHALQLHNHHAGHKQPLDGVLKPDGRFESLLRGELTFPP
jgi:hypothetical protein